jgi:hypothetical protein
MEGLVPDAANLYGETGYIKKAPTCPTTKTGYAIPAGNDDPVCPTAVEGHTLALAAAGTGTGTAAP